MEGQVRPLTGRTRSPFPALAAAEGLRMPSTAIRHISYDEEAHQLFVTFVPTGKTYVYFDVPHEVYEDFRAASSRGQFFNSHIRDNYDYREVAGAK
jgi:hypothetical protein